MNSISKNTPQQTQITLLPIRAQNQRERLQRIALIDITDSVPDKLVPYRMEVAKSCISILLELAIRANESLLTMPKAKGRRKVISSHRFITSGRVSYLEIDLHAGLSGASIQSFREHVSAVAPLHNWKVGPYSLLP